MSVIETVIKMSDQIATLVEEKRRLTAELAELRERFEVTDDLLNQATVTIGAVIACCTYNSNEDAKIGIYGISPDAFTRIDQFITNYNRAVSAGKVSVDVKPIQRPADPSLEEDEFDSMPIEKINQYLREHGYNPEKVGLRGEILAEALWNTRSAIRKEFCPNCEAETPCTHEAELFVCDICGEDFAKYIVSRNCNVSDVSMTQDVLTDVETPRSIENTNPDYYKEEIKVLLDDLIRDARDYEEALNIGRGISGAAYACNMSREKLRAWMTKAAVAMKSKDIVIASHEGRINKLTLDLLQIKGLYIKGGDGSHREGCEDVHWDCKIAHLEAELARRDEERADLLDKNNKLHGYYAEQVNKRVCLEGELRRRDEIIARLKETLPTLKISHNYCEDCWYSCPKAEGGCCNDAEGEHCNCGADKHNAIIDALMKELEKEATDADN